MSSCRAARWRCSTLLSTAAAWQQRCAAGYCSTLQGGGNAQQGAVKVMQRTAAPGVAVVWSRDVSQGEGAVPLPGVTWSAGRVSLSHVMRASAWRAPVLPGTPDLGSGDVRCSDGPAPHGLRRQCTSPHGIGSAIPTWVKPRRGMVSLPSARAGFREPQRRIGKVL